MIPCAASRSKSGRNSSSGDVRQLRRTFGRVHGEREQTSILDERHDGPESREAVVHASRDDLDDHLRLSLECHMRRLDACNHVEALGAHVDAAAGAGRGIQQLRAAFLRECDEFLDRLDAERRSDGQRTGGRADLRNAAEILQRVIRQLFLEHGRDGEPRTRPSAYVRPAWPAPPWWRQGFRRHRSVLVEDRLFPQLREFRTDQPSSDIGGAARRETDDQTDGLRREFLRRLRLSGGERK